MDLLLPLGDNSSYLNDINQDHLLGGMPFATPNYRKQVSENQQKYLKSQKLLISIKQPPL